MVTRRALLIGSATGGLTGVAHDVDAMAGWLGGLGFELDIRQRANATRDGMLDALNRLIRDSRSGDVAVLYYSGHGGYAQVRSHERMVGGRVAPRAIQYLVPTDHDKHEAFRGIFRVELSLAMQRLAEKTSNITAVLDCCHSTDVVREDDDAVLKGVIEPWGEGIEAHVVWLRAQGIDLDGLPEVRNPSVVLLSACEVTRQAFEVVRRSDGVRCGLFTDCLLHVVRGLPNPSQVTWNDLMRRVVDRALRSGVYQRPQASGPSSRYVLTERRQRRIGALTLQRVAGTWSLSGGEAAGVALGDRYRIDDPLAGTVPTEVAELEVSALDGYTSTLAAAPAGVKELAPGMLAVPHPGGPTHQRCRIDGSGALADELRGRVLEIAGLGLVGGEHTGQLAFALEVDDHQATVHDGAGRRLRWPWRDVIALDPLARRERVDAFIDDLRRLTRGSELLRLARALETKAVPRRLSHTLTWGLVEGDPGDRTSRPLPRHGAELEAGDRVFIRIENGSAWPIRVSVFNVGVGRAVTLLNPNEPEGIDLGAGEYELFGAPEFRSLTGLEVRWPHETPRDRPGEESLVVFVSSDTLPLTSWETSDGYDHVVRRDVGPGPASGPAPSYLVRHISFRLHPPKDGGCP